VNRSKLEVVAQILDSCRKEPTKGTHIMYRTYLNHMQIKTYLPLLLQDGLVSESEAGYAITVKGSEFLLGYESLIRLAPALRGDVTLRRETS